MKKYPKIPNELAVEELCSKLREIPMSILGPAFRMVEMEELE